MNREIKFRAMKDDMSNPKWVYGQLTYSPGGSPQIHEYRSALYSTCLKGTEGQYVGLKDKNGKDIYEGDVVLVHRKEANHPLKYVVVFNEDLAFRMRFIDRYIKGEDGFYDEPLTYSEYRYKEFAVIGNVHENPTLITK